MSRSNVIYITFCFVMIATSVFCQKKGEVVITGTVYMSSSTSLGTMNGGSTSEPQHLFKKQPIYFKNDSATVNGTTDSLGIFSIKLKQGVYTVYQEDGIKKGKNGMMQFGTATIELKMTKTLLR